MSQYLLMHRNDICGSLEIDTESGQFEGYKDYKTGKSPFLGHSDTRLMKKWWDSRAVPASRKMMQEVLKQSGCVNMETYLAKNLALSMTDAYWICPINANLRYEDVKLSSFVSYNDGKVPHHSATSYDLNASLGGQMEKYWDLNTNIPTLVKESYKYYGQQSTNELFATMVHRAQNNAIPFVEYSVMKTKDNGMICRCNAFTNDSVELIPALEVIEGSKIRNDQSLYENYIRICAELGIEESKIRDFMDYQTLTDFIISNTDEHLLNFGILRDSNTLEYIGPAPIFDSGNSMFYAESGIALSRAALLERKITSFYESEEKMLKNVQNKSIVDLSLLPNPKDVMDLYVTSGVPEEKAKAITKNYSTKIEMVHDFQHGMSISLYHERKNEKSRHVESRNDISFSMLCGLPGSGKTKYAEQLIQEMERRGYKKVEPNTLYSVEQAIKDSKYFINEQKLYELEINHTKQPTFVYISANETRQELKNKNDDFVFYVVDTRIRNAIGNGISVIYDATNLDKSTRQHYIELVGSVQKELYLINADPKQLDTNISEEKVQQMAYRLYMDPPALSEGWPHITECGDRPLLEIEHEEDISDFIDDFDVGDDR